MPRGKGYKKLGEEEKKPGFISRVKKAFTPPRTSRKAPTTRVSFLPGGGIKETTSGREAPSPRKQAIEAAKTMKSLGTVATELRREFPEANIPATVARKVMAELPASVKYFRKLPESQREVYVDDIKGWVRDKTKKGEKFTAREGHEHGIKGVRRVKAEEKSDRERAAAAGRS